MDYDVEIRVYKTPREDFYGIVERLGLEVKTHNKVTWATLEIPLTGATATWFLE
ncbi:MAG: hypothetical protein QW390_04230 [Candidatus Bathyarchaeia archaeon]